MEAACKSNLKRVSLELGGKSPNVVFEDADSEQLTVIHVSIYYKMCVFLYEMRGQHVVKNEKL